MTGIIGALAAILMPALAGARRQADAVVCAANLRQWGSTLEFYAAANRGTLPRRGQGIQPTKQIDRPTDWFNALPPMLKMQPYIELVAAGRVPRPGGEHSIWLCPSAVDTGGPNYWAYAMNMALSVWEATQNQGAPNKLAGVGNRSTMAFLMDGPGDRCAVFPSKFPGGYNPVPRHNAKVNILFLDGHVSAVRGDYIGVGTGVIVHPEIQWYPPNSTWNSAK